LKSWCQRLSTTSTTHSPLRVFFFLATFDIAFERFSCDTRHCILTRCFCFCFFLEFHCSEFWFFARIVLLSAVRGCAYGPAAFGMSIGDERWRWSFVILLSSLREFVLFGFCFYYTLRLRQSIRFLSKAHILCLRLCFVLVNNLSVFAVSPSGHPLHFSLR
jgi:hypothetical protein